MRRNRKRSRVPASSAGLEVALAGAGGGGISGGLRSAYAPAPNGLRGGTTKSPRWRGHGRGNGGRRRAIAEYGGGADAVHAGVV